MQTAQTYLWEGTYALLHTTGDTTLFRRGRCALLHTTGIIYHYMFIFPLMHINAII